MENNDNPVVTIQKYFEECFKKYPKSNHYGFKWKPYILNDNYIKIFSYIRDNNIKILLNFRNPLHVIISGIKHHNKEIKAHYKINEKEGLYKVRNLTVYVPIHNLLKKLEYKINNYELVEEFLKKNNINYLPIFYDTLKTKNINSWIDIFKFLEPNIIINNIFKSKVKYVLDNPTYEITTIKKDWDLIENYDEVLKTLTGTRFEKYIEKKY